MQKQDNDESCNSLAKTNLLIRVLTGRSTRGTSTALKLA
jgi:hypothetical protein